MWYSWGGLKPFDMATVRLFQCIFDIKTEILHFSATTAIPSSFMSLYLQQRGKIPNVKEENMQLSHCVTLNDDFQVRRPVEWFFFICQIMSFWFVKLQDKKSSHCQLIPLNQNPQWNKLMMWKMKIVTNCRPVQSLQGPSRLIRVQH